MSETHAPPKQLDAIISDLLAVRAHQSERINAARVQLDDAQAQFTVCDTALKALAPNIDTKRNRSSGRRKQRQPAMESILSTLRTSVEPMMARQLAHALISSRGQTADDVLINDTIKQVQQVLNHARKSRVVKKISETRPARWVIA